MLFFYHVVNLVQHNLVVEKPQGCVGEDDALFVGSLDALCVHHTTTWGGQILDTAPSSSVNIVREGEEGVTRASNAVELCCPFFPLFDRNGVNYAFKKALPSGFLSSFQYFSSHEEVDCIGLLRAFHTLFEGQAQHTGMMPEPPEICFPAS